jgi:arylsulfatase A-like enzyme
MLAGGATQRPNVLFLFADDQRADTIHAHGNPHIRTPVIDGLARNGVSFHRNYCFGSNNGAVCVPSRAMLMTGKTWLRVDAPTLNGAHLMPTHFAAQGYATFGAGKWHNGQASFLRAFQQGRNIMFGGMSDHTKVPLRDIGPDGKLTSERTGPGFSSEMFADATIEFLEKRDRSQPFFAYTAFTAPHDPRMPPLAERERYYRSLPPLPKNFQPQLPFDNGMMQSGRDENLGAWPRTEKMIRDQLAEYYGLVTHLDTQIGRVLQSLRRTGADRNTIIVYTADNGLALGSHGLLGKQSVFEHSMRTPLIIGGPGLPRGKSMQAFTYLLDLFPTLCDYCGVAAPADLDGQSLLPILKGTKLSVRDSVFLPFQDIQRAVRDERWKLIAYPRLGYLQLFDLANDPHEMRNLIDDPAAATQVPRLLALMKDWQTRSGDKVEVPTVSKAPPVMDLTGRARKPDQWQPEWIIKKYFEGSPQ